MIKIQKYITTFASIFSLLVFSSLVLDIVFINKASAAQCFEEKRRNVGGLFVDENPIIKRVGICTYDDLQGLGFNVGGLPKPFPAGDAPCYLWRSISGGLDVAPQTLDCNDPIINGPDVGTPSTPPDALDEGDLDNALGDNGISGGSEVGEKNCSDENGDLNEGNCGIIGLLNLVFNFVSGGVVLAVIGNIIFAGIRYSTAQGDPSATGAAKNRIRSAILALFMYFALYGFLQWLIPGGVF